ncbi:MAG: lipid-A-disaccharide synthase [Pirellulaceae bacterium]|nr:lipid-A-disaccharide synthase [Pirellulaceae bacterium]
MPKIFFSVGEPSGDLHAANLIRSLQTCSERLGVVQPKFRGLGGPKMRDAGCSLDFELTNLAVVGFAEVLPKLREFFRVADIASDVFARDRPDAVILVDFPGFNWHIAKRAKKFGIPVFYYLPPQLWAWGAWRLRKMRATVDHVLCNLPFEPEWYAKRKMQVEYVGHPFFDEIVERRLDQKFMDQWRDWDGLQVVVLPGSRTREVNSIWPMQLEAIRELSKRHPKTRFLVACYQDRHCLACKRLMTEADKSLNVEFFFGRTSELIELADCSLMKSGSVSLEMMARHKPAVVVYHVSRSFYAIGRCLVSLKSMSLPNMMAGKTVMPEFLAVGSTAKATGQAIAALDELLSSSEARDSQRAELRALSAAYAAPGASERAARLIMKELGAASSSVEMKRLTRTA